MLPVSQHKNVCSLYSVSLCLSLYTFLMGESVAGEKEHSLSLNRALSTTVSCFSYLLLHFILLQGEIRKESANFKNSQNKIIEA